MAGMKRSQIEGVLAGVVPEDHFQVVFAPTADTRRLIWLVGELDAGNIVLCPDNPAREGNITVLHAAFLSRQWEGQANRTYSFVASETWNADRFIEEMLKELESARVLSLDETVQPASMPVHEMLDLCAMAEAGDTFALTAKLTARARASNAFRRCFLGNVFRVDDKTEERMRTLRRNTPDNERTFMVSAGINWHNTTHLERLLPFLDRMEIA